MKRPGEGAAATSAQKTLNDLRPKSLSVNHPPTSSQQQQANKGKSFKDLVQSKKAPFLSVESLQADKLVIPGLVATGTTIANNNNTAM